MQRRDRGKRSGGGGGHAAQLRVPLFLLHMYGRSVSAGDYYSDLCSCSLTIHFRELMYRISVHADGRRREGMQE
jgi:hypothetical protein